MSGPTDPNSDDHHDEHAEDQDELDAVVIVDNGEPLVDFLEICPEIVFAPIRPVMQFPRVHLLRRSVAHMLKDAAARLPAGYKLEVAEGYRPFAVQQFIYRISLDRARKRFPGADEAKILAEAGRFVAPPFAVTPPPHLTGGAVDLAILDGEGKQLDFRSPYDMMDVRGAKMYARGLTAEAEDSRALLRSVLEPTGLTNYADEWWHWSYGDNGWALRVGAPHAIYGRVELPEDAHWIGDLANMPNENTPLPNFD